jgi:phage shock protein PspC (stress-responsive transcriptional regulator)
MKNSKIIALGGVLAGFSVLFQIVPVIFTELFTIVTIFSALSIYIACMLHPSVGLCSAAAAAVITLIISPHEGMFFICTNGITGLCLGLCSYYSISPTISILINSFALTTTLNILTVVFDINVFGVGIPLTFWLQTVCIFTFCTIYSFGYMHLAKFIYKRISGILAKRHIKIL